MATILLEQGESFEHFHTASSGTVLREGRARLHMNGRMLDLQRDVAVVVPADTSHTLVNIGPGTAVISCIH